MVWILALIAVIILLVFPVVRCALCHPVAVPVYGFKDLLKYIRCKLFNTCPTGDLDIFCGYFGYGKTLSLVHRVVGIYNKYNGLPVWCSRRKKFVTQRILILSNVQLNIPFVPLSSLAQVVAAGKANTDYDDEHDTLTITIVCLDELSVQLNSRSFKDNIDAYFLNTLLCCRHYHISFYGSAQRFQHCDKLLRDVTRNVIQCKKIWRFELLTYYDAWDMEHAQNPDMVKPLKTVCWFIHDKDYAAYDTLAVVDNLQKKVTEGDMMTQAEILANVSPVPVDTEGISRPSRKLRRVRRGK